jgi:sigma-B regulation protein RsbQ
MVAHTVLTRAQDTAALRRHNVTRTGAGAGRPLLFAHGFGCDQTVWSRVVPHLAGDHPVALMDLLGAGGSDLSAYDRSRHATLAGHADDLVAVCEALDLRDAVYVGHSVGAAVGILAAPRLRDRLAGLVLVAPSARYVDDPATGYRGGFTREEVDGLLEAITTNYAGWAAAMAPVVMANPDRPALAGELEAQFRRVDPSIAAHFARTTFLSDTRGDLPHVDLPTLVVQCTDDPMAAEEVGRYVHQGIPGSTFTMITATGHCPQLSAPAHTAAVIRTFADRP